MIQSAFDREYEVLVDDSYYESEAGTFLRTEVIFRQYPNGDVIALFPYMLTDPNDSDLCASYMHVGQHGDARYSIVLRQTIPADHEDYMKLLAELEYIGYKLRVVSRRQPRPLRAAHMAMLENVLVSSVEGRII